MHELEKKVRAQKKVVKELEGERNVTFEKYTLGAQDVCELVDRHRFLTMTLENKLHAEEIGIRSELHGLATHNEQASIAQRDMHGALARLNRMVVDLNNANYTLER